MMSEPDEDGAQAIGWLLFGSLAIICICIAQLTSEIVGWLVFGSVLFFFAIFCVVAYFMSGGK